MPLYVGLYKLTDQGRKTVKESPERFRRVLAAAEKAGIKIHQALYVTGQYDLIVISEAPNDDVGIAFSLGIISQGNVVGETLHAYTIEQMGKMTGRLP